MDWNPHHPHEKLGGLLLTRDKEQGHWGLSVSRLVQVSKLQVLLVQKIRESGGAGLPSMPLSIAWLFTKEETPQTDSVFGPWGFKPTGKIPDFFFLKTKRERKKKERKSKVRMNYHR